MRGRRLPARPSPSSATGTFCSCPSALSSPHRHTPAIPMPQGAWRMARALFQRAKIRESIEQGEGRRRGNGLHAGVCGAVWGCQHGTSQTAAIWRKQCSCWSHLHRAGYQVLPSSCLSPALLLPPLPNALASDSRGGQDSLAAPCPRRMVPSGHHVGTPQDRRQKHLQHQKHNQG